MGRQDRVRTSTWWWSWRWHRGRIRTGCWRSAAGWRRPPVGFAPPRWGPRTLDADVLWIDGVSLDDPELTVPHPRWRERRFVLAPLGELAPDLVDGSDLAGAGGEVAVVGTL